MIIHPAIATFWGTAHSPFITLGEPMPATVCAASDEKPGNSWRNTMRVIVLSAEEYRCLQQAFIIHFVQREIYMERLIDALIHFTDPYPTTEQEHQQQRAMLQRTAPDYLFQARGLARDRLFFETLQDEITRHTIITLSATAIFQIAILVVSVLGSTLGDFTPLHEKIAAFIVQPIPADESVMLTVQDPLRLPGLGENFL